MVIAYLCVVMPLNRLFIWLALLTGLLVLGRSLELDPDELRDHYAQEQLSMGYADPVSVALPIPVWFAPVPVVAAVAWRPATVADWRLPLPRRFFYVEPPPSPCRFLRLCVLLI